MSTSETIEQQRAAALEESPYRRDKWWGKSEDKPTGHDPADFDYHGERADYVAHRYLKDTSDRLLCPIALAADPDDPDSMHDRNHAVDVTDPEIHLPHVSSDQWGSVEYGQRSKRNRYNPEYGYIVGPHIPDRPMPAFMSILDDLLSHWADELSLRQSELQTLRRKGHRLKRAGDERDVTIVAELIEDATADEPVSE